MRVFISCLMMTVQYSIGVFAQPNILWSETYGSDGPDQIFCVNQTSDEGFILAGYSEVLLSNNMNILMVKTDGAGIEEWSQVYGGLFRR